MSKLKLAFKSFLTLLAGVGIGIGLTFGGVALAQTVPAGNVIVMLTKLGQVISVWPRTASFDVGATTTAQTPQGGLSLLEAVIPYNGYLNNVATTTFADAFDIASTTPGAATSTPDLFRINNAGCIGIVGTSTQTPIHLTVQASSTAVAGTGNNGFVTFAFGKCAG
jgi:hypothetical protein